MKTEQVYLIDPYMKEIDATVIAVNDGVVLDRTIFYAASGGQPSDTGWMEGRGRYEIKDVVKRDEIFHIAQPVPDIDERVKLQIDWDKRYKHMRLHTAIHVVSAIAMKEFNAMITGNQIYFEYARIDFNFREWNPEITKKLQERANEELKKNQPVEWFMMKRDDVLGIEGSVKVDPRLIPESDILRVVKIGDVDIQPDGGTHVRNTSEVGTIEIYKTENKGKNNKRMYFDVHR
ncbi:MAG: alanyl-tRNA editing protein [Thermoplasmatales archaeon]